MRRVEVTRRLPGRAVHLLDVENLLGGPGFTEIEVVGVMADYEILAERGERDHVIIACSHYAAKAAWFGCPEARRLVRSGPNGADLALLEVIERENLAARYDRVVIASGDGVFAEPAAVLQSLGAAVTVVTRRDGLSRRLQIAVRDVRFLEDLPIAVQSAAISRSA